MNLCVCCFLFTFLLILPTVAKCSCPHPCWLFAIIVIILLFDRIGLFHNIQRTYFGSSFDTTQARTASQVQNRAAESADANRSGSPVTLMLILFSVVLYVFALSFKAKSLIEPLINVVVICIEFLGILSRQMIRRPRRPLRE